MGDAGDSLALLGDGGKADKIGIWDDIEAVYMADCYHIDGIEMVPTSPDAARDLVAQSAVVKDIMPPPFVDSILAITNQEPREFEAIVTDLERHRYLEMA